jgi:hypothetical protein
LIQTCPAGTRLNLSRLARPQTRRSFDIAVTPHEGPDLGPNCHSTWCRPVAASVRTGRPELDRIRSRVHTRFARCRLAASEELPTDTCRPPHVRLFERHGITHKKDRPRDGVGPPRRPEAARGMARGASLTSILSGWPSSARPGHRPTWHGVMADVRATSGYVPAFLSGAGRPPPSSLVCAAPA